MENQPSEKTSGRSGAGRKRKPNPKFAEESESSSTSPSKRPGSKKAKQVTVSRSSNDQSSGAKSAKRAPHKRVSKQTEFYTPSNSDDSESDDGEGDDSDKDFIVDDSNENAKEAAKKKKDADKDAQLNEEHKNDRCMDKSLYFHTFEGQKEYFERFVAEIGSGGQFAICTGGSCELISKGSFQKRFNDISFGKGHGSFIRKWLSKKETKNRKRFDKIDYVPYHGDPPATNMNYLNMFQGFNPAAKLIKNEEAFAQANGKTFEEYVKLWRVVGKKLCEDSDEKFAVLEKWLAHMIKYPATRTDVAFAFVGSVQGNFKNAFFTPIGRILGDANYNLSSEVKDFFGEKDHTPSNTCTDTTDTSTNTRTNNYMPTNQVQTGV